MEGLLKLKALIDSRLREHPLVVLAIDGPCGSGKTTLARELRAMYRDSAVIHTDDFFLRPSQRTARRLHEPGGNMDRERLEKEVLEKLPAGLPFEYARYDCQADAFSPVRVNPGRLVVIEGSYSLHPDLLKHYTITVFLEADPETRLDRLRARLGEERLLEFINRWIPLEDAYFEAMGVKGRCDLALNT